MAEEFPGSYAMKPKGLPYIAHLMPDLSFAVCVSGEEAVARHLRDGCPGLPLDDNPAGSFREDDK